MKSCLVSTAHDDTPLAQLSDSNPIGNTEDRNQVQETSNAAAGEAVSMAPIIVSNGTDASIAE